MNPIDDVAGLYKLSNPAIPDGRTWSKLRKLGDHGDNYKRLNTTIYCKGLKTTVISLIEDDYYEMKTTERE